MSVAVIYPSSAIFFISSTLKLISLINPSETDKHNFKLSIASKKGSLSSCISFEYAKGNPFSIVKTLLKALDTLPVLPLINSAASGFLF